MPFPFSNLGRKSQSSARNSSQPQPHIQNQNQTHSRPPSRASTLPIPTPAFSDFGAHISGSTTGSVNQQHQTQPGFVNAESVNHAHPTFGNHNPHSGVVWATGDPCRSSTRTTTTTATATTHLTSTASSASSFVEVDNKAEANNAKASYYNTPSVNLNSTPARSSNSLNSNTSHAAADTNSSIYGEAYLAGVIPRSTTPPSFDIAQGGLASPFTYPATPNATYPATFTPTPTSFNHTATLTPNASSTAPTPNSFPPTISCTPPTPGIDFDIAGFEYLSLDSSTLSSAATSAAAFGGTPSSTSPAPRPASPAPRPNSPAPGPGHSTSTHTTDGHSTTSPFATPPPAYSIPAYSTPAGKSAPSCQSSPPISNAIITHSTIIMHTHTHNHISGGIGGPRGPRGSPRASPRASPRMVSRELPEVPGEGRGVGSSPRGSPRVLGRELPEVPAQRDVLRDWSWGLKGAVGEAFGYEGLGGMRMRRKEREEEERGEEGEGKEKGEVKEGVCGSAWAGENEKDASAVDFKKHDDTGGDESDGNSGRGGESDAESGRSRVDNQILAAGAAARDKRGGGSRVGTPVGKRELVGSSPRPAHGGVMSPGRAMSAKTPVIGAITLGAGVGQKLSFAAVVAKPTATSTSTANATTTSANATTITANTTTPASAATTNATTPAAAANTAAPTMTPTMMGNTRRTRSRMSVSDAPGSAVCAQANIGSQSDCLIVTQDPAAMVETVQDGEDEVETEAEGVVDPPFGGEEGRGWGEHERGETGGSAASATSVKSSMSGKSAMSYLSDMEAHLDMVGIDRTIVPDSSVGGLSTSVSAPALSSYSTPPTTSLISSSASFPAISGLASASSTTLTSSASASTLASSKSASTLTSSSSLGSTCSVDTIIDESPVIPAIMQFGEERGVRGLDGSLHAPSGGATGVGAGVGGSVSGSKGLGLGVVGEGERKAMKDGAVSTPNRLSGGGGDGSSVASLSPLPISFGDNSKTSVNATGSPLSGAVVGSGSAPGSARSGPPSVIGSERGSPPSSRHSPAATYDVPHKPVPGTVPLPEVAEERERERERGMQEAMERMGLQDRGVYASVYAQQQQQQQQQLQLQQQQELEHQHQQQRMELEHQYQQQHLQQQQRELEYQHHHQRGLGSQLNLAPTHLDIYGPSTSLGTGGFGHGISPQRSPNHIHAEVAGAGYGGIGMGLHSSSSAELSSAHLSSLHDNGLRTAPLPGSASAIDISAAAAASSGKTPNVYINGLPPHFPEDQLYALAAPYGEIRSVRTFTRHVRDCESGYGFVLFETIDAAERCIIALRKYRNLHPTFSKQIHKIPGTAYAQGVESTAPVGGGIDLSGAHPVGSDASFKAKMESLADPTSTNLYMEGLPLSIDEPTLGALVAPHRIVSSRFFQTRLSSPPRIIAFVRLDTRHGAEEIIERLHGRMVRGWNDTGSRISVRFADTTEQRELRRMERSAQEGDSAPARLTIAQAALLNLRGQDLQPTKAGPVIHTSGIGMGRLPSNSMRAGGLTTSASVPDFSSNLYHHQGMSGGLEVDYSLAPGRAAATVLNSRSHSPYDYDHGISQQHLMYSMGLTPPPPAAMPLSVDPTMTALVDSSQHTLGSVNAFSSAYGLRRTGVGLSTSQSLDNLQGYVNAHAGPAYTRTGYTPTEEYIMRGYADLAAQQQQLQIQQAQAQLQHGERRRPAPLNLNRQRSLEEMMGMGGGQEEHDMVPANISVGVRAYRTQASLNRVASGLNSVTSPLSPSEDEVHSHLSMQQQQSQRPLPISPLITQDQQQLNANELLAYHQQSAAAHMRSTTLPQHRTSGSSAQRHVQHNSMSMPPQNLKTPQHASVAAFSNAAASSGTIYESEGQGENARGDKVAGGHDSRPSATASKSQLSNSSGLFGDGMDQHSDSPSMISPTLTYSSQTPSTLSPATPFFGSFGNQEGFEKGVGVGFIGEQQQKKSPNPHGAVGSALGPSGLRG